MKDATNANMLMELQFLPQFLCIWTSLSISGLGYNLGVELSGEFWTIDDVLPNILLYDKTIMVLALS